MPTRRIETNSEKAREGYELGLKDREKRGPTIANVPQLITPRPAMTHLQVGTTKSAKLAPFP
jgi:hypothetical protein